MAVIHQYENCIDRLDIRHTYWIDVLPSCCHYRISDLARRNCSAIQRLTYLNYVDFHLPDTTSNMEHYNQYNNRIVPDPTYITYLCKN